VGNHAVTEGNGDADVRGCRGFGDHDIGHGRPIEFGRMEEPSHGDVLAAQQDNRPSWNRKPKNPSPAAGIRSSNQSWPSVSSARADKTKKAARTARRGDHLWPSWRATNAVVPSLTAPCLDVPSYLTLTVLVAF